MLMWILRGFFGVLIISIAFLTFRYFDRNDQFVQGLLWFLAVLVLGGVVVAGDIMIRNKQITTLSALYFGLLLGLLLGGLFSNAVVPFLSEDVNKVSPVVRVVQVLITGIFCYVVTSTLLQTKDEFRFIIPYVEFSKQVKGNKPLVLDTSVIIDGRIADICDTRIIDNKMIVPRFVLQELQGIADSSDKLKRNRGRRGLDVLKRMQTNPKVELQIHEANIPELREVQRVDERLVVFAKAMSARVVTNDFNLNKIAQLQGVDVINLNEVANALKTVALPGENLVVKLVKPGDQVGQGVGYLDDGTMVVVEGGRGNIGQEIVLVVTSAPSDSRRPNDIRQDRRAGPAAAVRRNCQDTGLPTKLKPVPRTRFAVGTWERPDETANCHAPDFVSGAVHRRGGSSASSRVAAGERRLIASTSAAAAALAAVFRTEPGEPPRRRPIGSRTDQARHGGAQGLRESAARPVRTLSPRRRQTSRSVGRGRVEAVLSHESSGLPP